ncbi:MAG: radical SAM protein [Methylobacter sp.]|nr:radical SAM protein [Methylobacter sp.]
MTLAKSSIPPSSEWDEATYLSENPDVALAVDAGTMSSGYIHYCNHGRLEGRRGAFLSTANNTTLRLTRHCLDPWINFEVSAKGEVRPCCISSGMGQLEDIEKQRHAAAFRDLRRSLLSGELPDMCQRCHIRSMTAVENLELSVKSLFPPEQADLLCPGALAELRVDINEQCNLRCTYCAVSQPGYQGIPMSETILQKIIESLPKQVDKLQINLNGHGETTYHPSWVSFAKRIQELGAMATILSNFAKPFNDEEIDIFARMRVIQISLDTVDEDLLRDIRRKVSLGTILRNIHKIRIQAFKRGLNPLWSISCGIYDKNISGLDDIAVFAITEGFKSITFWNLVEYPAISEDAVTARSLSSLPKHEREHAAKKIGEVLALLKKHHVFVEIPTDLTGGLSV